MTSYIVSNHKRKLISKENFLTKRIKLFIKIHYKSCVIIKCDIEADKFTSQQNKMRKLSINEHALVALSFRVFDLF